MLSCWKAGYMHPYFDVQVRLLECSAGGALILVLPWKSSPVWVLAPLYWHLEHYLPWSRLHKSWNCKSLFARYMCDTETTYQYLNREFGACYLRNFPIRLENPHVISSNQMWAGVVPAGPSGRPFNSSYRNRDSIEYKQELGNAIGTYTIVNSITMLVSQLFYLNFIWVIVGFHEFLCSS